MPEIKHQFTGGKMNKDLDERLVPNGQYRDAMNIQVSTSESSGVGTIQNILGNTLGCSADYMTGLPRTVGSVADEANNLLYWLVSGSEDNLGNNLVIGSTVSFKDVIIRLNVSTQLCEPVFVDKYKFCVGIEPVSGLSNSLLLPNNSLYSNVISNMQATGYNNGTASFGPTPIIGIGSLSALPVNYSINSTSSSTPFTPPVIQLGDTGTPNNSNIYIRGFWNGTNYTNIHFSAADHALPGAPITQTNLPPDGASQFWVPLSFIPTNHNITPGSTITNYTPGFSGITGGSPIYTGNILNGVGDITIYSIVSGQVTDHTGSPTQAWIITVGEIGGIYDGGFNNLSHCWHDTSGTKYNGCGYYTGIFQKNATIAAGFQNGDAYPFYEIEASIIPIDITLTSFLSTGTINIAASSSGWLDEIYNALFTFDPVANTSTPTGAQLLIDSFAGSGNNFPPNSCVDPNSIINDPSFDPANGVYDSTFEIINCTTLLPLPAGAILINNNYRPITLNLIGGAFEGIILSEDVALNGVDTVCFEADRVLNFEHDRLITGIDVFDDALIWTDNFTEPKKINITRSIQGTDVLGETHTAVVNQNSGYDLINDYHPIEEQHITVIRKSPKNILSLELSDGRDPFLSYAGITRVGLSSATTAINNSSNPNTSLDFSSSAIGDVVSFYIQTDVSGASSMDFQWEKGGYLLLKEFDTTPYQAPAVPLANWSIRGLITQASINKFNNTLTPLVLVEIEIVGINGTPASPDNTNNTDPLEYVVDYEDTDPVIFEDKFPRFSYRYKYEDGEYSTFAPWSEVAFLPGSFSYESKRGFNEAMLSGVRSIKLKGFNDAPAWAMQTGRDIVEIDILYKEESSPNVYLVETISPIDILSVGSTQLPWYSNEYLIKSEVVKSTLPSNQLLRSWDNVPKKALAQSISGNRIIYANYEQNYDLKVDGNNYKPDFKNSLSTWSANPLVDTASKSIKSLRDYKLGVVFTDEYGRETPVLISENGGFRVEKTNSIDSNRLKVGLRGDPPPEMAYYKFYIKETSSEYYNLAMDRWYKAEDGNIWLAFPSSDRNKIDLDTFLYFKRGAQDDENVIENSTKYKVLAIENEAPEFIKTRKIRIGKATHYKTTSRIFGNTTQPLDQAPRVNGISFTINYAPAGFEDTSANRLDLITDDLSVQFVSLNNSSSQYKISSITSDFESSDPTVQTTSTITSYFVTLDTNLKNDINFIFDQPDPNASEIIDEISIVFTKSVIENKPKFNGKFFAKIENDGKIQTQISDDSVGLNYIDTASKMVYMLEDDDKLLSGVSQSAMVAGDYTNLVTLDYSSEVHNLARNPGGNNFNHVVARQTFFSDYNQYTIQGIINDPNDYTGVASDGLWTSAGGLVGNTEYFRAQGEIKGWWGRIDNMQRYDKKSNGYPNFTRMGTWFLDRSTKKYTIPNAQDNNLFWPSATDQNSSMDWANPQSTNAPISGVGKGITHNSNSSHVQLGFGGLGDPKFHTQQTIVNGGVLNWYGNTDGENSYWGVGDGNILHDDNVTQQFTNSLEAGFSFRWREDPTETIYKIEGQTSYVKNLRFGRHDEGFEYLNGQPQDYRTLMGSNSSYTKSFGFKVTPSMASWDPSAAPGTPMASGLNLGLGSTTPYFLDSTSPISIGDTIITLQDVTGIKIGMSVGQTLQFDDITKVVSIDFQLNKITIDVAATASATGGALILADFAIRVTESHLYHPTFSPSVDPQEAWIIVDGIKSKCLNGNNLKPEYSLHEGMKLDIYNVGSVNILSVPVTSDPTGEDINLAIIKIEPHEPDVITGATRYKLTLGGYYTPTNANSLGYEITSAGFIPKTRCGFKQVAMNGASNWTKSNTDVSMINIGYSPGVTATGQVAAVGYEMVFMEPQEEYSDGGNLPEDPFIWETEPKDKNNLDVYYEISENNPTTLNTKTIANAIPVGSVVESNNGSGFSILSVTKEFVVQNNFVSGQEIRLSSSLWIGPGIAPDGTQPIAPGDILIITKPNGVKFGVEIVSMTPDIVTPTTSSIFKIEPKLFHANYSLNWHNCYSFANGVESNRVKDTFNSPFITNGVKVSTTLGENYKRERRKSGLIYSGLYNSNSGVNNLNQFIAAEKITKDINPIYGSIQKLHSRSTADGDLIALCEDRVLKILANKDALFNADGNPQLIATDRVLGQAVPFSGDYGISKNPESFASESYRAYFTDKVKGAVLRLSKDGLTAISDAGMKDWFRDNLKLNNILTGSYDDKKNEYNITLKQVEEAGNFPEGLTVSYREDVKGWVSFKSFTPENAISCANEYYTFKNADAWLHHVEQFDTLTGKEIGRNTFYYIPKDSSFEVILNESAETVKSFNTINYEGSQSKVDQFLIDAVTGLSDGEYYNLAAKKGWYVDSISTNKERGTISEFIEKEGKWFNYIKGKNVQLTGQYVFVDSSGYSTYDQSSFSTQGIGKMMTAPIYSGVVGCTDPTASNYNSSAVTDDGSCIAVVFGCIDPAAGNHNPLANTDDGTCLYYGCMDPTQFNYDATATFDDGSCIPIVSGCTDATQLNYDASANVDDGSCTSYLYGCTDPTALNYNVNANTDDGSCIAVVFGCTDNLYIQFNPFANVDNGSCSTLIVNGCTDPSASNYDSAATVDDGSCTYDVLGCTDILYTEFNPSATADDGSCSELVVLGCTDPDFIEFDSLANTDTNPTLCITLAIPGCIDLNATNYDSLANTDDGSCIYVINVPGCIDPAAYNYLFNILGQPVPGANQDDGSCTFTGCTDFNACNPSTFAYNSQTVLATNDDGSCEYTSCAGCLDPTANNIDSNATIADNSQCTYTAISGCMDLNDPNFDPLATIDTNPTSCAPYGFGCTDTTADNYNPGADEDGTCVWFGCTDPTAENYDSDYYTYLSNYQTYLASIVNPAANNFDVNGGNIVDNGSCTYYVPAIGDYYQGGIIFHLFANGGGLIAAANDQPTGQWGCQGLAITGANLGGINGGYQNTQDIIAGCNQAPIAAKLANDLEVLDINTSVVYSDWYLPSSGQLAKMYNKIGPGSLSNSANLVPGSEYWASNEGNGNNEAGKAFVVKMNTVPPYSTSLVSKANDRISRPIRTFI